MRVLTDIEAEFLDYARPEREAPYITSNEVVVTGLIELGYLRIVDWGRSYRDTVITDSGLLALRCHAAYKASL